MTTAANSPIRTEEHAGWAELVLQRPYRRNALDITSAMALLDFSRSAESQHRVVLLRGEGPTFCAGLDLKAMHEHDGTNWMEDFFRHWIPLHAALAQLDVPVVCAMRGAAINAGAALALAADFLIVEEDSDLRLGEVRQGMVAPIGIGWLTRRHSAALARRITLHGGPVSGPELTRLGIAHDCAPRDQSLARARALAAELSTSPTAGTRRTLAGLRAAEGAEEPFAYFTRLCDSAAIRQQPATAVPRIDSP